MTTDISARVAWHDDGRMAPSTYQTSRSPALGTDYFWEHMGMLQRDDYRAHREKKHVWYERFSPGRLIITEESSDLSKQADEVIRRYFTR